jgi:hypothetical protein
MFTIYELRSDGFLHYQGSAELPAEATKVAGALALFLRAAGFTTALDVYVTQKRARQMPLTVWRASELGLLPGAVREVAA